MFHKHFLNFDTYFATLIILFLAQHQQLFNSIRQTYVFIKAFLFVFVNPYDSNICIDHEINN